MVLMFSNAKMNTKHQISHLTVTYKKSKKDNFYKIYLEFYSIRLVAINKWISSITIPNLMKKMKSLERVDIPRYFYFCLTPPKLGAICENRCVFLFSKKKTHRGG